MPFKHNAARRLRISWARYRVTNWTAYEAGLRRRGGIAACVLTDGDEDDGALVPALLRQPEGALASLTADGDATVIASTKLPLPCSQGYRLR